MTDLSNCAEVAEILEGRFVFAALRTYEGFKRSRQAADCICYCIDSELVYEPFASDFGPLNMGATYRYCQRTAELVQEAKQKGKRLCHFCGPQTDAKANSAVLVGAFQIFMLGRTPQVAYEYLKHMEPFLPFRDASSGPSSLGLSVLDTLEGLAKARSQGLLDLPRFDIVDYELNERVENGDTSWIVPGKLLAFSGPAPVSETFYGYSTKVPEDYWKYFKQKNITGVVRLNRPLYKASRFTSGGFRHYELYFPDGSCPTEELVDKFLAIAEGEPGALAVHCKAGLGRTGVLICCYMMKHYNFTAIEALGYIRVCRPGSVIGQQQNYIIAQESRMHAAGADYRKVTGRTHPAASVAPQGPATQQKAEKKGYFTGVYNLQVSANCQVDETGVKGLTIDPQRVTAPVFVQTTVSRLSSLLRFKSPSVREMTGKAGVARATAPNGQPRKIPAALLAAGEDGLKAFAADEDQPNSAKGEQWTITSSTLVDSGASSFKQLGPAIQNRS